jgi:vitamin B12/bleomycin/antimicrobial peptide transport system ATP-binding/permease protein
MAMADGDRIAIGRQTAARLWRVIHNFVASEVGGRAIGMGVGLLALLVAINGLNVVNSYVGRDFMTAIERRDRTGFLREALLYTGVFGLSTIAAVVYRFTEERLGLLWRGWLTHRLTRIYLQGRLYYRLQAASGGLSNPDQRIADDVRSLTTGTLSLCLIFLNGMFTIVAFSGVLWTISRLLFAVGVGYAMVGSLLAVRFGRPLVRLNYDQSDREATFRAELVHVRENAESVALVRREEHFGFRLERTIDALIANLRRLIAVNRNLGFFTTGYNYMIQLIPALIVAPLFIRGSAQFGEIPQASMAFAHLVGAFSLVVNQFGQLSSYAAVLARLSALGEAAETAPSPGTPDIAVADEGGRLAFERLTLRAPQDARLLVRELSLELVPAACALVVGPHDATVALERAIAGMWPSGEGRIVRPTDVMFLPERPYLPPGTLRQLLVGANATALAGEDEHLWGALRIAGVEGAVRRAGGPDVELNWDNALSLQEQRLLEIARMLLAAPSFVVLTRLDAHLGAATASEARATLSARGIGYLALENEMPAAARFDEIVRIAADGSWTRTVDRSATG